MSSLFQNYMFARIFWVGGLAFLILCSMFGGFSKVFYPAVVDVGLSVGVQRTLGVVQFARRQCCCGHRIDDSRLLLPVSTFGLERVAQYYRRFSTDVLCYGLRYIEYIAVL